MTRLRVVRWSTVLSLVAICLFAPIGVQTQGASAPILLVVNSGSSNPYGPYLAEILKAEGINSFSTVELSAITPSTLNAAQVVVLAETARQARETTMIENYVAGGGRLVTMRPSASLYTSLGVSAGAGATAEGYVGIDTGSVTGDGFTAVTLPFHGTADHYDLTPGASAVAQLYGGQSTPAGFPAVVRFGNTATWSYDLARSVVYARQGNPANAGVDQDGLPPLRTNDVFYNAIDLDRVSIPHADVQMRLFSRILTDLLSDAMPVPRLWYFPGTARTLMVLTGDSHTFDQNAHQALISSVEAHGGRIAIYFARFVPYPAAGIAQWRQNGHEVGLHPYAQADNQNLQAGFVAGENWFAVQGWGAPSRTVRNHQIAWEGWVDAAQVAVNHGMGLDDSFYTWGPPVMYQNGTQAHGYINGSGLPMRFINQSGQIIPLYQQVTSLVDEQLVVGRLFGAFVLERRAGRVTPTHRRQPGGRLLRHCDTVPRGLLHVRRGPALG